MSELKAGVIRTPHNEGISFDRDSSHIAVTEDEFLSERISVRKWDDTEWHNPTREYLGLEDK